MQSLLLGARAYSGAASSLLQLLGIGLLRIVSHHMGALAGQSCNVICPGCIKLGLEPSQVQLPALKPETRLPSLSQSAVIRDCEGLAQADKAGELQQTFPTSKVLSAKLSASLGTK